MAFNLEELNKLRKKNIKQYVMVKRNKDEMIEKYMSSVEKS